MKYPYVKKLVKQGELTIMGWYYSIEEGEIYNYDKKSKSFLRVE
jgi:carbonic anhydrase